MPLSNKIVDQTKEKFKNARWTRPLCRASTDDSSSVCRLLQRPTHLSTRRNSALPRSCRPRPQPYGDASSHQSQRRISEELDLKSNTNSRSSRRWPTKSMLPVPATLVHAQYFIKHETRMVSAGEVGTSSLWGDSANEIRAKIGHCGVERGDKNLAKACRAHQTLRMARLDFVSRTH